jgi:type I restriction enzyme S subunit
MSDWAHTHLGELFDVVYRYPTYFGIEYVDTGVAEIRGELLESNGRIRNDYRFIADRTASWFPRVRLKEGDFVLSVRGTLGKIGLVTAEQVDAVITANLIRLSPDRSIVDSRWLLQVLTSDGFLGQLDNACSQTTIKTIQVPELLQIEIDVPPLDQQRKIARILTTVDNLIEKTEALIAKYQAIKQGMMHDLFTRGVDENGHLRPTYEEAPDLYKPSELGWLPKEWEVRKCSEVCREIVVGIVIQPSKYYQTEGVPVLRSANVRETGIDGADLVYMSEASNRLLAKSMLCAGDIVTVRTGYPGTSCVVPPDCDGANCVDIIISRPGGNVRSEFLARWINSDFGRNQILRMQGGLAQQHFNIGEMKNLLIPLPSIAEQHRIEDILLTQQSHVFSGKSHLSKLRAQKSGLMQDLLSGKVRVQADDSEETATHA